VNIIIHDVRFIKEADEILKRGGILIRLNKEGISSNTHISETELDNYDKFTHVYNNNGTLNDLEEYLINLKI
jgi:hypothetical protein